MIIQYTQEEKIKKTEVHRSDERQMVVKSLQSC